MLVESHAIAASKNIRFMISSVRFTSLSPTSYHKYAREGVKLP